MSIIGGFKWFICLVMGGSLVMGQSAPTGDSVTAETRTLLREFQDLAGDRILFGHQSTNINGVGWTIQGMSDVEKISGRYPALVGYDFLNLDNGWPGYLQLLRTKALESVARGAVITFSWHMWNPVTGGDFKDKSPAITEILSNGPKHGLYLSQLDQLAKFFSSLRGTDGRLVPVIFRPFHEADGKWFWWGVDSSANYIRLWRETVHYLRDVKGVHNLLYAYSMDTPDRELSLENYPGGEYVDIVGLDFYYWPVNPFWTFETSRFERAMNALMSFSENVGKPAALTEFGRQGGIPSVFWGPNFDLISKTPRFREIAYLMTWTNRSTSDYYAPYPGHPGVPDFLRMLENTLLKMAPVK